MSFSARSIRCSPRRQSSPSISNSRAPRSTAPPRKPTCSRSEGTQEPGNANMKILGLLLSTILGLAELSPAAAQDWPTRPVKAITTTSAGGLSDIFMRALGEELRQKWGQPLIIENRPGGAMNLGTRACADSAPDGYTICITNADAMLYNQYLYKKLPFDPETSVTPITNAFHLIHMLVVNANL